MFMGTGMMMVAGRGAVLPPISVVASSNTSGAAGTLTGLQPGDDVLVFARKSSGAGAMGFPTGNPLGYTIKATASGAAASARLFHVKVTADMLVDGVFSSGTFTNAGPGPRVQMIALRGVASFSTARSATIPFTTTGRPFSGASGLGARGFVVGWSYLTSGTPPVPAGTTIPPGMDSGGRMYTVASGDSWAPAAGTAGSDLDWIEISIGASQSTIVQAVATQTAPFLGYAVPSGEIGDAFPGLSSEVAAYVADGVKQVRLDFRQSELGGGSYTTQDARVAALRGAGITVMGILNPSTDLSDSTERAGYAAYCGAVAAHYAGDVAFWEICNEPNIASTAILAANYVLALPLAYAAIKASDPTAEVIAGSLASVESNTGGFQNAVTFATAIRDNCAGFYDSLSYHAYTDSATVGWLSNIGASWHSRTLLLGIIALGFDRIHLTETGMPTIGTDLTEANQAKWLREIYGEVSTWPEIVSCYWYSFINRQAQAAGQDGFGIRRADGRPKLALHLLQERTLIENDDTPTFEHQKGKGDSTHALLRRFADATGGGLTFSAVSLPAGVTISAAGVVTIADGTVTPQLATNCIARGAAANGTSADFNFTITVFHPNLILTNPTFAGSVTGWQATGTATIAYDPEEDNALVTVSGSGGGIADNQTITCTTTPSAHEMLVKVRQARDTPFAGTLNMGYEAVDVQTGSLTDNYVWHRRDVTTSDTDAALNLRRFTAVTGKFNLDEVIFRLKL